MAVARRISRSINRMSQSVYRAGCPSMSHDDLLQTLTSQLHELAEQMIELARVCTLLRRRPHAGRGFILIIAPTPQQRAIAGAMQKRFALWHAAVRATLTRCGITDPSLQRTIK